MIDVTTAEQIQVGLAGVWDRAYPLVLERVTRVEKATVELSKASPRVETVVAGRTDAHKLAGMLGTFGLDRGTELARVLEGRLSSPSAGEAAENKRLVAELRSTIEHAHIG